MKLTHFLGENNLRSTKYVLIIWKFDLKRSQAVTKMDNKNNYA